MSLRSTRQYAEVLGAGDGKARVGRQYIEVLLELGLAAVSITDTLGLVQSTEVAGPLREALQQVVFFRSTAVGHLGVINRGVTDTLTFVDYAPSNIPATVVDTMTLGNVGVRRAIVSDTIALVDTANGGKAGTVEDTASFTQAVTTRAVYRRSIADALTLLHAGTYQSDNLACVTRQYSPFVGFSTDTETTPPTTVPATLGVGVLTLTYPFVSPTTTVVLRNPEFANKDSLTFNRVNRETRGGTLVIYADPNWPKIETLQVEIQCISTGQKADLAAFLVASLGQEIGLLDYENRQWKGIILDPDTAIACPERGDYTVSFEFEGELC